MAYSAQIDALMVVLTMTAIYFTLLPDQHGSPSLLDGTKPSADRSLGWTSLWIAVRNTLAPLSLAAATLTKLVPILLLPILYWHWSWRQRATFGIAMTLLLLPWGMRSGWGLDGPLDGTGLFGAMRVFAAQWNFNSGLFHWLERWLGAPGYGPPDPVAKWVVIAIMALLMAAVSLSARRQRSGLSTLRLGVVPFMAYLSLSTTVHPWYALICLSLLPILSPAPNEGRWRWLLVAPWIYLSGALFLSYLTYLDRSSPGELEWVRTLEWVPTLAMLAAAAIMTLRLRLRKATTLGRPAAAGAWIAPPRRRQYVTQITAGLEGVPYNKT